MRDSLTGEIIDSAFVIHTTIGPGLLESAYQQCLALEMAKRGLRFEKEKTVSFRYDNEIIDIGYRADFIVENEVIVELKSIEKIIPLHEAQLLTYMKLAKLSKGLLINFNSKLLKDGIKRMVL